MLAAQPNKYRVADLTEIDESAWYRPRFVPTWRCPPNARPKLTGRRLALVLYPLCQTPPRLCHFCQNLAMACVIGLLGQALTFFRE